MHLFQNARWIMSIDREVQHLSDVLEIIKEIAMEQSLEQVTVLLTPLESCVIFGENVRARYKTVIEQTPPIQVTISSYQWGHPKGFDLPIWM